MSFFFREALIRTKYPSDPDYWEPFATFNTSLGGNPQNFKVELIVAADGMAIYDEDALSVLSATTIRLGTTGTAAQGLLSHNQQGTHQSFGAGAVLTGEVIGSTAAIPARFRYKVTGDTDIVWPSLPGPTGPGAGFVLRYLLIYDITDPSQGWMMIDSGDVKGKSFSGEDMTLDIPILAEEKAVGVNV